MQSCCQETCKRIREEMVQTLKLLDEDSVATWQSPSIAAHEMLNAFDRAVNEEK